MNSRFTVKFIKEIFFKTKFLGVVIALLGAYILFPPYFDKGLYPVDPSMSLDPSWEITLNFANIQNLVWGKDIAFTYGPLGYLSTRVGWGVNSLSLLFFDLFVAFNFFYIFYKSFIDSKHKKLTVFLIAVLCFLTPFYFGAATSILLLGFLMFWIRQALEDNKIINYIFQILLLVLMFFVKLNTGMISFILILPFIGYQIITKKNNYYFYIVYFVSLFSLIFLFSKILNVDLPLYFKSGMNMISGFNEIMHLELGLDNEFYMALAFIGLSAIIMAVKVYSEKFSLKSLVIVFVFALPIYVLYKQGFVRADMGHIVDFFLYAMFYVFVIRDFHVVQQRFNGKEIVLVMAFLVVFGAKRKEETFFYLDQRLDKSEYVAGLKNFTEISGVHLFPNENQIPSNVISRIGNSEVDIFPWNIHLIFENKLNYSPRPVVQSYSAYTPYLENLNFEHYNSDKAPKFVLYQFESIDNRQPLFDESKVNLALLKNYICVDTFSMKEKQMLLLEKKKDFKPIKFEKIKEYEAPIKTAISPEKDVFYEIEVSTSFKGKIRSLAKHSPELYIMMNTKDGKGNGFKISGKLLKTGIFGSNLILNTSDFKKILENQALPDPQQVNNYVVWPEKDHMYQDKIKITEYKIVQ